jgi:hypothetical protein
MRYRSPPETGAAFFALWSGLPYTDHEILVCVYNDEYRAYQCAEVMGCAVRPVTADELQDYLVWRRTLKPEAPFLDPLVSLYLGERAPILPLSGVIAYLTAHP